MKLNERLKKYRQMITGYCHTCQNFQSGKSGPCPKCIFDSKSGETPVSYQKRLEPHG